MINSTKFVSRVIAEITPGQNSMAMISITEPFTAFGIAKLKDGWHSVLRLEFHDIEIPVFDAPYVMMTMEDAHAIIDFVHQVSPNVESIVVHCRAGISRSAAVSKWIAETYQLPFDHDYQHYNKHVYQLLSEVGKQFKSK